VFQSFWGRLKGATRSRGVGELPGTSQADEAGHETDLEREFSAEEELERAELKRRRAEVPEALP
jgi:hypothetical protein